MFARTRRALPFILATALMAVAHPARAQEQSVVAPRLSAPVTAPASAVAPAALPASGPMMDAATVGVRHQAEAVETAQRRGGSRPGTALMIVGGVAVLVGLVVGDDAGYAISIAGAVVGLYGLYQYLQ